MTFMGKPIGDYFRFQMLLLALTVGIGLARLVLSLTGRAGDFGPVVSMTGLSVIAIVYLPIRLHSKDFGGYRHLWFLFVVQLGVAAIISAIGILIAAATGVPNAFEPDPANTNYIVHALSHFPLFPIMAPVFWLPACLFLWIARRVLPAPRAKA